MTPAELANWLAQFEADNTLPDGSWRSAAAERRAAEMWAELEQSAQPATEE